MVSKYGSIKHIEVESLKDIKKEFIAQKKEYDKGIEPIASDIENYFIVSFHKFSFLFHKTLQTVLKVTSMHTTSELVDLIEGLNSRNYDMSKEIKKKEDDIVKEPDKKVFFELKKELASMIYEKNYFSMIEKNVVKNNLIFELRAFVDRINEMEFSGEQIKKSDVQFMIPRGNEYVSKIIDAEILRTAGTKSFVESIMGGLKNKEKEKKPKKPVQRPKNWYKNLSLEELRPIHKVLKKTYSQEEIGFFLQFVDKNIKKHSVEAITRALVAKGWPEKIVKKSLKNLTSKK